MKSLPDSFYKDWVIRPFRSVGPLKFGMSRAEVYDLLGEPTELLPRFPSTDGSPCEAYVEKRDDGDLSRYFRLHFSNDEFEGIEMAYGTDPVFMGVHLYTEIYGEVLRQLSQQIPEIDPSDVKWNEVNLEIHGLHFGQHSYLCPELHDDYPYAESVYVYSSKVEQQPLSQVCDDLKKALFGYTEH